MYGLGLVYFFLFVCKFDKMWDETVLNLVVFVTVWLYCDIDKGHIVEAKHPANPDTKHLQLHNPKPDFITDFNFSSGLRNCL